GGVGGEVEGFDLGTHGVAGHDEPAVTAGGVIPEFAMEPAHIVAQVDVVGEGLRGTGGPWIRARERRVAEIDELFVAAFAAKWAGNPHVALNASWAARPPPSRRSPHLRR